ncbi:uncharacterized protein DC041_0003449 [Schistosoma bovis]|uniref:Uncharacterized protein n=1 Tax=Schistosoma bovis TaxID=6184 RepID=A0A430QD68_SCHBO|nr:uncharacterized protein DC041_0003449 [Schistosoma bovis]
MVDNNNNTNNSNSNNEQYERIKHLLQHRNSSIINNQLGDGDRINQSINNNNTNNNNIDLQQINSLTETMIIRNAKRKSILPNIMEQQTEFNDEFVNILLQRNRELMLKLKKQTKSKLFKHQIPITTSSSSSSSFTPPSVLPSTSISMPYEMTNNNRSLRNINNTNIILNEINEENQQQQPSQYTTQTVIHDKRHKKSI